ncbi:MAG: serine hydrolase [Rhodoferax sp.]|uniref:serine hydrolase domain-containing protein n=1 Tax=Rhodoferax sp. TaxID=50421 RepID=UPI00261F8B94|nr:serine hydrolase domain-containing protein [Rhodoferax sp.]MDD5333766.1 serine hydrolase [Rhodoferax sp.]
MKQTPSTSVDTGAARYRDTPTPGLSRRELLQLAGCSGIGLLAPGLLASCGTGGFSYDATIASARTAIRKALADTDTPAISVALLDRDRLIWAEAFGVIDKVTQTAPTPETLFCIGSCSKMIATVAVMILVERGLIDLDRPLAAYLSDFRMASPEYTQITVRMLLSHSSGFPGTDYRGIFSHQPRAGYAAQVMQTLATARLKHAPGEMSVYCNDGFTMVEPLLQALSGKSYAQFVADEILTPLGMPSSRFALAPFAPGSFAPDFSGDAKQPQEYTLAYASGGLYSTPTEMGRLARMLLSGGQLDGKRLLQRESIAEMARDQTLTQPLRPVILPDGYGLGWDGVRAGGLAAVGVTAWHKNGGTSVYGSDFFVLPDEGLALMISGTSTGYGSGTLAELILLHALRERGRIAALPSALPATPPPPASASDAQLAALAGVYAHYQGLLRLQIEADRTVSLAKYSAGTWAPASAFLKLRSDGTFASDNSAVAYWASPAQGEDYLVARLPYGLGHYTFAVTFAQKLAPKAPLSAAWQARLGRNWLAVNEPPDSLGISAASPIFTLAAAPDLPGYVLAKAGPIDKQDQIADASGSDALARMCLKIPMVKGRDLDDVLIETRNGEEWVRLGSSVFRPAHSVPALGLGSHAVAIGPEGFAEWRQLPATGWLTLSGSLAWRLYDQDFAPVTSGSGNGASALPGHGAGAYLLLYGAANSSIDVTLS